jgi:hypothetical protein
VPSFEAFLVVTRTAGPEAGAFAALVDVPAPAGEELAALELDELVALLLLPHAATTRAAAIGAIAITLCTAPPFVGLTLD